MTVWLTVDEAAKHIRAKSTRLLREAIKAGELPSYRYGKGDIRLKTEDVDAWLEGRTWTPATGTA